MASTDIPKSPWHEGEKALQETMGVSERMEMFGAKVIRQFMPDSHRVFFEQLPFIVAGAVDEAGAPWATMLTGYPGFISSPNDTQLDLLLTPDDCDPANHGMNEGSAVAFIGIEFHTRRRNRVNGVIVDRTPTSLSVKVAQSFGNCPQYITQRDYRFASDPQKVSGAVISDRISLDDASRATIESADTFFVASYVDLPEGRQVDVSHRGGDKGFARIGEDGMLTIPDYSGNRYFNTLGNLIKNPRAGLLFPDFETGDVLQISGETDVLLDDPQMKTFEGAQRLWTVRPTRVVRRRCAIPLRWTLII